MVHLSSDDWPVDGSFDTGVMDGGESSELVFDEPVIYLVFCALHASRDGGGMSGVLVVGAGVMIVAGLAAGLSLCGGRENL